jgi:hypothetical protein
LPFRTINEPFLFQQSDDAFRRSLLVRPKIRSRRQSLAPRPQEYG